MASSSLYQSELVRNGTTELLIDGDVRENQYGPYVPVKLRDGSRKFLTIENERVREVLEQAAQGEWLKVTATGSRGNAAISISSNGSSSAAPQRPSRAEAPAASAGSGSSLLLMYQALDHAQWILEDRGGEYKNYDLITLAGHLAQVAATKGEMLPDVPTK